MKDLTTTTDKIITDDQGHEMFRVRIYSKSCNRSMCVRISWHIYILCATCKEENDIENEHCSNCTCQL